MLVNYLIILIYLWFNTVNGNDNLEVNRNRSSSGDLCIVPDHPKNGKLICLENTTALPGDEVQPFSILKFECKSDYKLLPDTKLALCTNGSFGIIPQCVRTCSAVEPSKGTKVTCELNGALVDCSERQSNGTKAQIQCEPLYEDLTLQRRQFRYCIDGTWDYSWPKCKSVCGLKPLKAITNIPLMKSSVEKSDYPWHVGIYMATSLENICGGAIISPKLTLSAAHSFDKENPKQYLVAAGKYYRSYNDTRDNGAQFTKVSQIIIHSDYNNGEPFMAYDIAILIHETPFIITSFVLPVCFQSNSNFDYSTLIGKTGIVTGWGYAKPTSLPSETLKHIEVKYYSKDVCELPSEFKSYYVPYAPDKLCAGILKTGKVICNGNSGGPLVFLDETNRYFIRGITSVSPRQIREGCNENQTTLYTSVSYHNDFIQKIQSQYPD